MKNFNKRESSGGRPFGGRSGGGSGFGGGGFGGKKFGGGGGGFGARSGGRSEMFEATCSGCGKGCEVPFKPAHGKPVYCNSCFKKEGGGREERSFGGREERSFGGRDSGRDSGRDRFAEKRMHDATCDECGNRCEVPFKPTGEKPVYCRDCFDGGKSDFSAPKKSFAPSSTGAGVSGQQIEQLNAKLDKILKTLEIIQGKKEFVVEKPKAVAEAPKKAEEKKVEEKKVVEKKVVAKAPAKKAPAKAPAKKAAPAKAKKK